jgi:hypothetical protein
MLGRRSAEAVTDRDSHLSMTRVVHSILHTLAVVALLLAAVGASPAYAGPREQAKRMHDRLVGVPPSASVLDSMATAIASGSPLAAASEALSDPLFYSTTLRNLVTPWTNVERTVFADLNDYTATVIGIVRDDRSFRDVLTADVVYTGAAGVVTPAYSHTDNAHYQALADARVDLSDPALLVARTQSGLPGSMLGPGDAAGVLTTRAAGEAFFSAGTNRRMWRFVAIHYLCRDMEELNDITRASDRVRQDVTRSPGGDSRICHNTCVGCHSGMDALAGAFAYFEWDMDLERVVFTRGQVQPKHLINANTFPGGYVTVDDSWINYWRSGPNSLLGWRGAAASGNGPQSLGAEVAQSRAFSECQVEKVFERVCLRPPSDAADRSEVQRIADVFDAQGQSLRQVFAETAVYCMGD